MDIKFKNGRSKAFNLEELKGKVVKVVSCGRSVDGFYMYLRESNGDIFAVDLNRNIGRDVILNDLNSVDLSDLRMAMIVIYYNAADYPGKYLARIWDSDKPTNVVIVNDNIDYLRNLIPKNMTNIGREKEDDSCIVEVWL